MSTPSFEYAYIENVEDLRQYQRGGYHPIHIYDRLQQRYRIVHKLGHGAFSTAWLARDEQMSKYVAIKIGTADSDEGEVDILSQLTNGVTASNFSAERVSAIPPVLDRFKLEGPNGMHPCVVTVPARCSLRDAILASRSWLFPLDVARSLATQLTMAVVHVHSRGFAHGDLHFGNILLQLPSSLDNLPLEQLYAKFGAPEPQAITRLDHQPFNIKPGVPSHAVQPMQLCIASDKIPLNEAKLLLTDFGVTFRPSEKSRFESYTPLVIRPPEAIFEPTTPLSFASDIWSLGCTIFELLAHRSLIDGMLAPQDDITAQQVHLQGRMPSKWWDKWEERPKWFEDGGKPLSNERDIWRWDRLFEQDIQEPRRSRKMSIVSEEEKHCFLDLLRWMLAWRPEERPSAAEVLSTEWMKKWALPAYEQGKEHWS